ncbi:hypothetical protein [Pseudorhizobium banfieldiae]|uniref:hypothetical protein n=1 Tax=Pseudorhizobium banfieldiae TaxID=1125847 RepID=UPI000699052A|nr:hypothetical protein [Pseudorhizobium banfieldiae]CAD6602575.1 hypothetical protein RNT25_01155 [arsenite-oxidising bacterium NT-25]
MRDLQIISSALDWLRSAEEASAEGLDVLRHPDLVRMSERQLADLPFLRHPETRSHGIGDALKLTRCA